jgi:FkbM family methyltransferase
VPGEHGIHWEAFEMPSFRSGAESAVHFTRRAARYAWRQWRGPPDGYLRSCKGVIHVGANTGQEAAAYAALGLPVVWIEPIPDVFNRLLKNIAGYPNQRAIQALITDADGQMVTLHVSSNDGLSSSILDLAQHKDIWPDIGFVSDLTLSSVTLPSVLKREAIDLALYDALVMDTQGAELHILKGARAILPAFKYIKSEAADFEVYAGCATGKTLDAFLTGAGFRFIRRDDFAKREAGGTCFDVLYKRR